MSVEEIIIKYVKVKSLHKYKNNLDSLKKCVRISVFWGVLKFLDFFYKTC